MLTQESNLAGKEGIIRCIFLSVSSISKQEYANLDDSLCFLCSNLFYWEFPISTLCVQKKKIYKASRINAQQLKISAVSIL